MSSDRPVCKCGKPLSQGKSEFSVYQRSLGICNACYRTRPKVVKKCRHADCDDKVAGGYGKVAIAARGEGFCRKHWLEWQGPSEIHPESRTLSAIARCVDACFADMDKMLEEFGEEVEDLDASAGILERLVDQVRAKRDAVSELEDTLNHRVTVVGRRLKVLAKKILDGG